MNRFYALVVFVCLALVACAAPVATPVPTAAPVRPTTLRIEVPGDPDIADLPRLVAVDTLREMGYNVETMEISDNTMSAQALVQGDLDFGQLNTNIAWAAVQNGAKIATILDSNIESRVLVTMPNIQSCADLNGKRVGIQSTKSTQTLLLFRYIAKNCPTIEPETIILANESIRLAALATGELDATTVNFAILREFQRNDKTELHILVDFTQEFPSLRYASQVTSRALLEKYPETVQDFVRASLLARRKLQEPQFLSEQIVKYLKRRPEDAQETAALILARPLWDLNGGWTPEGLQSTLDFYVESEVLDSGLTLNQIADLTPLNAVLDEIGRK